jgi:transcriptional regulator with XRE-family HTH domain
MTKLANKVGLSLSYVSDLAAGRAPSSIVLARFAKFFGVDPKEFRAEALAPRIVQISATEVKGELRVATLYSDGKIGVAYPEREEVGV